MERCPECDTDIPLEYARVGYVCPGCKTRLIWDGVRFQVRPDILKGIPVRPDTRPYKQRGTKILSAPIQHTPGSIVCPVCLREVSGLETLTHASVTMKESRKVTKSETELVYNRATGKVERITEERKLLIPVVVRGYVCDDCVREHTDRVKVTDAQPQRYNQRQRGDEWAD